MESLEVIIISVVDIYRSKMSHLFSDPLQEFLRSVSCREPSRPVERTPPLSITGAYSCHTQSTRDGTRGHVPVSPNHWLVWSGSTLHISPQTLCNRKETNGLFLVWRSDIFYIVSIIYISLDNINLKSCTFIKKSFAWIPDSFGNCLITQIVWTKHWWQISMT